MLLTAGAALAQPDSGGPRPDVVPNPTQVPIDGGLSLLLAAGGVYGLKRLRVAQTKK
ncbi:PID-CTERM protein-sorting domain-containing protein [Hymenobacter sp. IS2118]|uniref:PID-CTERM protein-sorting domain-containing protein n=1 Tax=Hymenobacter sp. IS2118 TaxID=1505605 RepID=UPI000AD36690|nr:hypothetical protein [Hymenobacter sp. IS2118]